MPCCLHRYAWFTLPGCLTLVLGTLAGLVQAQTPAPFSPSFSKAVIFATNSVLIGQGAYILSGDIIVNEAPQSPTLAADVALALAPSATTPNSDALVVADRLRVDPGAVILGTAFFTQAEGQGTMAHAVSPVPGGFPILDASEIPPFPSVTPGTTPVNVGKGALVTLDAGDYGVITVAHGGTLTFTGGLYHIQALHAGARTQLLFQGPTELRVAEQFLTGRDAIIGPDEAVSAPPTAADLVVLVAGQNGTEAPHPFPDTRPAAVTLGRRTLVAATFWAPNGTVSLQQATVAEGAFVGRDVWIEPDVQITFNSFFQHGPPRVRPATFRVAEKSATGTFVGTVTVSDPDAGQRHTFALTAGNTKGAFALNASTGQLTVANSAALDVKTTPSFRLTVQVTHHGRAPLSGSAAITVNVTAANAAPVVNAATFSVAENSVTGTVVGTVTFSDPDVGQSHTFALTGNTGGAFALNASTGQLTVANSTALNFEATPTFPLTVRVTDNGTPPLFGSATITVNLRNVNEAPVVNAATFSVAENSVTGTVVGTVTFSDPDVGQSGTLNITAGNTGGAFALNASTGQLTVDSSAALDFETTPIFMLTVQVTDNCCRVSSPLSGSATIRVNLTDVNENEAPTAVNDTPATTNPTTDEATAFDIDVLGNDSDTDGPLPLVVNSVNTTGTLGQVTNNGSDITYDPNGQFASLNPSATATDTFTYTVCDGFAPPACDSATVTVTITGLNDAPVLNDSGALRLDTIDQDAVDNPGMLVADLLASDAGGNPITDPDTGALAGIAVIEVNNTNGTWQFDPDGGTDWQNFAPAPSNSNATLLAPTATIRLLPDTSGENPGITFRAWDQTSGTNGATGVDVRVNGGTTAFSTATATASIIVNPVPQDVTYDAVGNTELVAGTEGPGPAGNAFTTASNGVLATTPTLTVQAGTSATNAGGSVTIDAQGRFNYTPPKGLTGVAADRFTYTVGGVRTATVTINLSGRVWYVQNDASGADTGTSTDPFQTLQSAAAASAAGDTIFVFLGDSRMGNPYVGITLKANQRLLGHQDTSFRVGTATVETPNLPNPVDQPALGNATGPGVTVDNVTGVEIAGLDITGLDHGIAVRAAGALTIEIHDNTLTGGTGDGVNVVTSGGTAAVALSLHDNVLAATVPGGAGARLVGSAGSTLTITNFANNSVNGAITDGTGISITNAIFDADTTPGGEFQVVNAGTMAIGSAADRVGAAGILLDQVSGHLAFNNLDIFSSNTAFQARGTGTSTDTTGFRLTTGSGSTFNADGGTALHLENLSVGTTTLAGTATSTDSSATGVTLNAIDGTVTLTGNITNPTGTAFALSGGTASVTYDGDISTNSASSLVSIASHQTGTVTFNGTLAATNGSGIQLDNADGTYRFTDTITLNGGNARVAIAGGSDGTITFDDATITNPSGTAFSVVGGAANITYKGGITKASTGLLVSVTGNYTGTLNFQTGTRTATDGAGILLDNVNGTVQFDGTTTLSGSAHVAIANGSGRFTFNNATTIMNPSGTAFSVNGGTANVTYNGSITKNTAGALVNVTNHATGTLLFQGGTLSATSGDGIVLDNADGTVQFASTTTLNGGSARVAITGSDGTITFGSAANTITNPTGVAFSVSGGSPTVVYNGSITDTSDVAVSVASTTGGSVTLGGTVTSSAAGIAISNTVGAVTIAAANLSGGATVSIANNTDVVTFTDLQIDHSTGTANAVHITDGAGNITIRVNAANGIQSTVNRLVNIMNRAGGTITFNGGPLRGLVGSTGINISGAIGANTVQFDSAVNLGTDTNRLTGATIVAVDNNGTGAEVSFANLQVFTTTSIGIDARGGGTLNVGDGRVDTRNTGATGIQLIGLTVGMTLSSVTVNGLGDLEGLSFTNVNGAFTVTGATTIGTVSSVRVGIDINRGNASYTFGETTIGNNRRSTGIRIMETGGTLQFGTTTVSGAGNNTSGISISGTTGGSVTFNSTNINNASGTAAGLALTNNTATITSSGGTIQGSANAEVNITGGAANITIASVITNTAGRAVEVTGRTGGTVTLSGTISDTSGTVPRTGILVQNNTGGITTFSGASKALSTGANTAVTLTNNAGHTINFTNGGLDIDTTTATGFNATGGGTVTVTTGANANTISSGTGTALNVASTIIGANGLTFESISSSGSTNGIMLSATGAGSLTVTGDGGGTNNGSGGTIQNATGAGVLLTNVGNVSLNYVNITNPGTDGIRATTLNSGLTVNRSNISDSSGTAPADKAIDIGDFVTGTPVSGTINITNSVIGPASGNLPHDSLAIGISGGTSTWNITSTTFQRTGNSGISMEVRGSANVTLNITSSTFSGVVNTVAARGIFVNNLDDSVLNTTIQTSTFTNNNIHIDLNQQNDTDPNGSHTFRVLNNTTMTGARSHAMNIFAATGGGGAFTGTVEGNTIGNAGVAGSGSEIGNGIRVNINGDSDATMRLHNNTIRQTPNGRGIEIIARNGTGGLDITVTNNNVNPQALSDPLAAILVQSNCLTICNTVRADVRNNTVPSDTDVTDLLNTYLALVESSTSTLELMDTTSPISGTCASELAATNTGSTGVLGGCALITGPISTPP